MYLDFSRDILVVLKRVGHNSEDSVELNEEIHKAAPMLIIFQNAPSVFSVEVRLLLPFSMQLRAGLEH
jgi:hypothetical protein